MKIIALDLGSHMALAHNGFDDVVICEAKLVEGIRAHRAGKILVWLEARFCEILLYCPIQAVVYERPFARGFDATRSGWGLAGIIEALASKYNLAVLDATPQQIKSFAIGKPKRKVHFATVAGKKTRVKATSAERKAAAETEKLAMITAAKAHGYVGNNEHEADAYWTLQYALSSATVLPPTPKKRKKS